MRLLKKYFSLEVIIVGILTCIIFAVSLKYVDNSNLGVIPTVLLYVTFSTVVTLIQVNLRKISFYQFLISYSILNICALTLGFILYYIENTIIKGYGSTILFTVYFANFFLVLPSLLISGVKHFNRENVALLYI